MIIDGKRIAKEMQEAQKKKLETYTSTPGLTFILVGNDPASHTYVRMKKKACARVGIRSKVLELPESISEKELLDIIEQENQDRKVDGILVQMPLPKQIRTQKVTEQIAPDKDVDGFHPINVGKLLLGDETGFVPCTPSGIMVLLQKSGILPASKHVVILGRSNIVGKPMAALLMQKNKNANATVTLAHSLTKNLKEYTRSADILIAAMGKPSYVTKNMIKKGAVIIDVGISRIDSNGREKLQGDVCFDEVAPLCSYITPVPGGVGPMTITMLLENTITSFLRRNSKV